MIRDHPSNCVKGQYSEFFWSLFSHIQTEYEEISLDSVSMGQNTDQKNS